VSVFVARKEIKKSQCAETYVYITHHSQGKEYVFNGKYSAVPLLIPQLTVSI